MLTFPRVSVAPLTSATQLCAAILGALVIAGAHGCGEDDTAISSDAQVDAQRGDATASDAGPAPVQIEGCENSLGAHCLLPYPSSVFLRDDPTSATGFRVDLPEQHMPVDTMDARIQRLSTWERFDGFSPSTSLMAGFHGKVDASALPGELAIASTLTAESLTLLLDVDTGEWVAHFAEVDEWPARRDATTTLYLRPATRLAEDHHYIAAIRTGLQYMDGVAVQPSPFFTALRDGVEGDPLTEARRPAMESIFTALEAAGVPRTELLVAWDFHTASGASVRGDLLRMWDDTKARWEAGSDGLGVCTVQSVEDDVNESLWRRIRGTFTVPLYMDMPQEGARATRGADGEVMFNGVAEAPFEVSIPVSVHDRVAAGDGPGRGLMYGHGLLGSARQVSSGGTQVALQQLELVGFGTDYWGLSDSDTDWILTQVMPEFGNFDAVGERLMQGTINSLVLMKAFAAEGGPCSDMEQMRVVVGGESRPVMDDRARYYYGISQGGIMGGTLAALSDTIDRYALQVGAVNYSTMVRRSRDFAAFETVLAAWYSSKLERDWLIVSTQSNWSLAEPAAYAPHIFGEALPGVANGGRRVLYQVSRYDTEVSNVASDMAARGMGLGVFDSSVYLPWNVPVIEEDEAPSAYIIFHLAEVEPLATGTRNPATDNNAHGDLRYQSEVLTQLDRFLRPDGTVVDTCPANSCRLDNDRL